MYGHRIVKFVVKCVKLLYLHYIDVVILVAVHIVQSVKSGNVLLVQSLCVPVCRCDGDMQHATCNMYDVNILAC